jgi:hypothetical protein
MKQKNYSKAIKDLALGSAFIYALVGSSYVGTFKTSHQSADLATGKSTPSFLETKLLESLGFNANELILPQYKIKSNENKQ